jgi:import receptor subunit TOM70
LLALKDEDYDSIKSICDDITSSDEFPILPSSKMEIVSLQALFESFLGHHDSAFKNFNYILKSEDSSKDVKINALIKRATLYIQLNNPEKGYKDFEKAIKIDEKCPDIYHHRGQVLYTCIRIHVFHYMFIAIR